MKNHSRIKLNIGFTLIELLISVTLFMLLIGITAKILSTLNKMGAKAVTIVEMHQQAGEILNVFTNDMRNMHLTTAYSMSFSDPLVPQTTFMSNQKREQGKASGSYGPYSLSADKTNTDFIWVRWEMDHLNGTLKRGRSRPPATSYIIASSAETNIHVTTQTSDKGISQYQRFATPQTQMLYFEGGAKLWDDNVAWTWNADGGTASVAGSLPGDKRRLFHNCAFEDSTGNYNYPDPKFISIQNYKFLIYNKSVIGNSSPLSDECYAVKNADGLSYNKDRINLIGSLDKTTPSDPDKAVELYPNQITRLCDNIDCVNISYHLANENEPVSDDTLNDVDSIDVNGTG
ncbi:MAG: prepilin-type N-terminal cleavage/methylation domain-containing protein, partial [Planctomycetes bacterium]|nr:prepilin-type N-terminal cleavage/methylation domain-containing protein [Planctomycetota bacterium]